MKRKPILFSTADQIDDCITEYFTWIEGEYHLEMLPLKPTGKNLPEVCEQKVWDRSPQPATLTGLALHLGFDSLQAFETYENKGKFASALKRARLRVENEYEKQLLTQPSTGAIFALKSLGWLDKATEKVADGQPTPLSIKIEIVETGVIPACQEQDVVI
ncbi:terminase small subunit [Mucilaginibacter sp. PAMB04274]|uniref:terminase small subunit n=1 Tax=Mucilaginibacter sp. PAMB04274 TaxID=3138568 RepID=UPI0031F67577